MSIKLQNQLNERNKKELTELAALYDVKGAYKLNKQPLIDEIINAISEKAIETIAIFDDEQFKLFESLVESSQIAELPYDYAKYIFLEYVGFTFVWKIPQTKTEVEFDEVVEKEIVIADEIIEIYNNIKSDEKLYAKLLELRETNNKYNDYKKACLRLYGAVPTNMLKAVYETNEGEELDMDKFYHFLSKKSYIESDFNIIDGYLVHEALFINDENDFRDMIKASENIDKYYLPEKSELMKYTDELYYEHTLHIEKLESHLSKKYNLDKDKLEEAMIELIGTNLVSLNTDATMIDMILKSWQDLGINIKTQDELKKIVDMILKVINTTRMWSNKGFTPEELKASTQRVNVNKIGRNEPCPCGSGKKYKHCCGKNK